MPNDLVRIWLHSLLRSASPSEFVAIFSHESLRDEVLAALPDDAIDVRRRIVSEGSLPLDVHLILLEKFFTSLNSQEVRDYAGDALRRCLRIHFGQNEVQTIVRLLEVMGDSLDAKWMVLYSLELGVPASVASRNLIAFNLAPAVPRERIMAAVYDLACVLDSRHVIDVDIPAIYATTNLFADAAHYVSSESRAACGRILPLLMRSTQAPVSALVAVAFPVVYREYANGNEISEVMKFVPFLDWDRCKSARRELVSAFLLSSVWTPGDLALTSCRCGDVKRIFRRVAKTYDGRVYLGRVLGDLGHLPAECRITVENIVSDINSDWSSDYN